MYILKCLYQARKVSSHVHVYMCVSGIDFASFYDFSIGLWTLLRQNGIFLFFIILYINGANNMFL
jgi:hypothetical protein